MGSFGTTEIILIVAVLFLLFGASRLPQLAKSFGQTRKAFKDGMREAAMREHRTAQHAERICDDIGVRHHRTTGDEKPEPNGNGFIDKRFARYGGENGV